MALAKSVFVSKWTPVGAVAIDRQYWLEQASTEVTEETHLYIDGQLLRLEAGEHRLQTIRRGLKRCSRQPLRNASSSTVSNSGRWTSSTSTVQKEGWTTFSVKERFTGSSTTSTAWKRKRLPLSHLRTSANRWKRCLKSGDEGGKHQSSQRPNQGFYFATRRT